MALVISVPNVARAQSYMARGDITIKPARLSVTTVRLQLDRAEYALKSCYNKRLSRHKRLRGKVVARFAVRRDGSVTHSRASGIKHDVSACVARTIATLRFAKLPRRVRVTVVLGFDTNKYRLRRLMKHKRTAQYKMSPLSPKMKKLLGTRAGIERVLARGPVFSKDLGFGSLTGRGLLTGHRTNLPRLRAGSVTARGRLPRSIIRRYLHRRRYQFRRCYARALQHKHKHKPKLKGLVKLSFTIGPRGNVIRTTTRGLNKRIRACLRRELRRMRFPKPRGGGIVKVRYPMYFAPPISMGVRAGRGYDYTVGPIGRGNARRNAHGGTPGSAHKPRSKAARKKAAPKYVMIVVGGSGKPGGVSGRGPVSLDIAIAKTKHSKPPHMRLDTVTSHGGLDHGVVSRYLRRGSQWSRFRRCYSARAHKSHLKGRVRLGFAVVATGRVTRIRSRGLDKRVGACLQRALRTLRFPRPRHGRTTSVQFSLYFSPSKPAHR